MKTGLVLEGGGVRGIYTAGVLDVFMEEGIKFDGMVGVSAGACHGCSMLSDQKGRSLRYYLEYCNDPRFMSFRNLLKTGDFVGVEFSYHQLPEELDIYDFEAFKKCEIPFYVVATNVESGKSEYIRITDMLAQIDYIRASASLPYFSRIVEIGDKKYLDGGCADAIPLEGFQNLGFEKNIVVLTRPKGYFKKPEMSLLAKLYYRKYPEFVKTMLKRHEIYNNAVKFVEEAEKAGKVFVIRPEGALPAGRLEHDRNKVQATYDFGASDAKKAIPKLKEWLER